MQKMHILLAAALPLVAFVETIITARESRYKLETVPLSKQGQKNEDPCPIAKSTSSRLDANPSLKTLFHPFQSNHTNTDQYWIRPGIRKSQKSHLDERYEEVAAGLC